jgi:hypothetical protein
LGCNGWLFAQARPSRFSGIDGPCAATDRTGERDFLFFEM